MEDETGEHGAADPDQGAGHKGLCPIIGIGASAGGIEALKHMFPHVDPACGMAFIIVQHLDPAHESALAEIVARSSALPVTTIANDTLVQPNHVYVIPPNSGLTINEGKLMLAPPAVARGFRNTIDDFFLSLGRDQAENAACVVLSGTGSDGTVGLRAIKENGGLTLAQAGAEYDGMMRSAVATGLVDFVLPVEEIPAKIVEYFSHVTEIADQANERGPTPDTADQLGQIVALLRTHTGHDFKGYKSSTIVRRVQRRMHVLQIETMPAFIEHLQKNPREIMPLFQDLLIGVTNFFRDPVAFAALERTVIPELFRNKSAEDTVRVWVPGCATGEEAYSIAMLLRDGMPTSRAPRLQVFATDIDERALETARMGRYPASIVKGVSAQRLERYFLREDGTYRVASDLREICLFSSHNLLHDPPFSRLDLISCRNLLIYLKAELQDQIIPLFHYALNQNGYLFLGTSENIPTNSRLFTPVDKTHRIFRRRTYLERQVPIFPLTAREMHRHRSPRAGRRLPVAEPNVRTVAKRQLLDNFAPPYVVVDAGGEVLQSSRRTGKYLELPSGSPDTNVFNMARPGLRLDLRAALHKATTDGRATIRMRATLGVNGGRQEIDLCVQPLRLEGATDNVYMIIFQDLGPVELPTDPETLPEDEIEGATVRQLELELRTARELLQTTAEELEASNEELKSSNEELQSANEELQSANEELQTSKEELQSINEELQTVNAELNARIEDLSRANNDMSNLLESTQIATVFLDRNLAVKSFTPAAKDVFCLVESDAGRPIMHVRARFECPTLQEDAERVLRTLSRIERRVSSNEDGARYIMRLLPYRTADNVINGVVLTFTDVTRISAAEAQIERLTADWKSHITERTALLDILPVGVMISDESTGTLVNTYGATLLGQENVPRGLSPAPTAFRLLEGDRELAPDDQPLQQARRTGKAVLGWQGRLRASNGRSAHVMISATPLFAEDGRARGAIAAIVDMSAHKEAEEHQQLLLDELQHRVKNILTTISSLATRMSKTSRSVDEFHESFLSRLGAMARVHDLLVVGAWTGADLRSLIAAAVEPHASAGSANVRLAGPAVTLAADAAATIGMVLNELATNASKYGALSVPDGTVAVTWDIVDDQTPVRRVHLTWVEQGGPTVDPASPAGFGTGFITRSVEYELDGTASLDLDPGGLRCTIAFPLSTRPVLPSHRGDGDAYPP